MVLRTKKMNWRWKENVIEEVEEYRYLASVLQSNEKQDKQVKERIKKAVTVIGQVWCIGMKRCKRDWGRRLWLFDK